MVGIVSLDKRTRFIKILIVKEVKISANFKNFKFQFQKLTEERSTTSKLHELYFFNGCYPEETIQSSSHKRLLGIF